MSWRNLLGSVALLLLGWMLGHIVIAHGAHSAEEVTVCDKRPSGTETPQTRADGRFTIDVVGIIKNQFLHGSNYTVVLKADEHSSFIAFLIMADGEVKGDPRKPLYMKPGKLMPKSNSIVQTQMHSGCKNAVQQSDNSPKNLVEVEWIAPPKDQGCVTIHAMVAESQDVWYMDDGPLSMRVCEDTRKSEDIPPQPIDKCNACEEVKYELTFEGQWSRNTHPLHFPEVLTRRFSDLVGASHSSKYHLWDFNNKASAGLKLLSEAGNTTLLEQEIQNHFGKGGVRTLIKASGQGVTKLLEPTSAIFRADRYHHLISIATSIVPSPDWFLGVTHFELCFENNTWVNEREYYLHLIDAGTDNGVSYESSNEETLPPGLITPIMERPDNAKSPFFNLNPGPLRHFAKMRVKMLRLYRETCNGGQDLNQWYEQSQINGDLDETTPNPIDYIDVDGCLVSEWHEWSNCSANCGMEGLRYRERFNIVNGFEYRYNASSNLPPPPEECNNIKVFDTEKCTSDPC